MLQDAEAKMQPSASEQIARLLTGNWMTQALYVVAKLGIPDLVKDGPRSADELAQATSTHGPSLYRLLRALASIGVFVESAGQRFGLTPLAECLRSDVPGSQRALAIMNGEEFYQAWGDLLYSVQTGKPAFEEILEMPLFDFLARNAHKGHVFDEAMVSVHGRETAAMLDAYNFSGISVLADIGGGNGSLLQAVLTRHRSLRGILYDLAHVVERARHSVQAAGLAERCQVIGGNFFQSVPAGADAYLLRHIIHDWDDAKATTILKNVHQAMGKGGKLLLIEGVIPPGNDPSFTKLLDLTMLVIPGGKERTEPEYQDLFARAGFQLTRIVPTPTEISVIEGEKA
jgi:hypothetical protein